MLYAATFAVALSVVGQAVDLTPNVATLRRGGVQSDFPALAVDSAGTPWVAYVEWNGSDADTLCLAKRGDDGFNQVLSLGKPGIIHQPALAADGSGALVVVWSQVNDKNIMELK